MMLPSTRSWVPGSSGSRRRCRIGFCKCLSGAPRLQVPSRQRRRIARPRLSGRQGGRWRGHVDLSVHLSP
jgi:hypothetical protein